LGAGAEELYLSRISQAGRKDPGARHYGKVLAVHCGGRIFAGHQRLADVFITTKIKCGLSFGASSMKSQQVELDILAYLVKNPGARDTITGVAVWWLPARGVTYQNDDLKASLADLIEKGFVLARKEANGQIHYRLNGRKRGEILSFLGQSGN
jgi:hypothetical protein